MKKVICFCRVSTLRQDLTVQRDAVLEKIRKDGFSDDEIEIVEGKESAIKLDEYERVTLNELKEKIETYPTVKHIYFFAIDRLARKVSVVLSIVDYMIERGINLVFLNPYPMQTLRDGKEDSIGKMFLTFLSIGAEMEMKMKQERFAYKRQAMKEAKQILTGKVIFGYQLGANSYPVIDEERAKVIRYIFNEYVKGASLSEISDAIILNGWFPTNYAFKLNYVTRIQGMIHNLAYSGRDDKHNYPPIVTPELQDAAIAKGTKNKTKRTNNIYYAKGILKTIDKRTNRLYNLCCNITNLNYYYRYEDGGAVSINTNVADTIALMEAQELNYIIFEHQKLAQPQEIEKQKDEIMKMIGSHLNVRAELEQTKKRISNTYIMGRIDEEEYNAQWREAEKKIKGIDIKITGLQEEYEKLNRVTDLTQEVVQPTTDEGKYKLIKEYIQEIRVWKESKWCVMMQVIPSEQLLFSTVAHTYRYTCNGGKIKLYRIIGSREEDVTDSIIYRFSRKRDKTKKGVAN